MAGTALEWSCGSAVAITVGSIITIITGAADKRTEPFRAMRQPATQARA
jgi:hypothetical protein